MHKLLRLARASFRRLNLIARGALHVHARGPPRSTRGTPSALPRESETREKETIREQAATRDVRGCIARRLDRRNGSGSYAIAASRRAESSEGSANEAIERILIKRSYPLIAAYAVIRLVVR